MSWKRKASEGESSFMNLSDILPMQHHLPVSDILPMQHHPPVCPYSCMTDWEMQLIAVSLASQYHSADFCPEKIWNVQIQVIRHHIILVTEGFMSSHLALDTVRICLGRLCSNCISLKEAKCFIKAKVRRKLQRLNRKYFGSAGHEFSVTAIQCYHCHLKTGKR